MINEGRMHRTRSRARWTILFVFVLSMFVLAPLGNGAAAETASVDQAQPNILFSGLPTASIVYGPKCDIVDSTYIGQGGNQDWSLVNNRITYNALDANSLYQIYTANPDGSDATCITCKDIPFGPQANRNKFNPKWDPTGQYLIMEVEYTYHNLSWKNTAPHIQEQLLNGVWSDLWVTDATGTKWSRLTWTRSNGAYGVLDPVWSPDGKKIFWSELLGGPSARRQFGIWRLKVADIMIANGRASLSNVRDITPPTGYFFESHSFTPDGQSVVFTSDLALPGRWRMDIYSMNLQTDQITELSNGGHWNEHADFNPNGQLVTYMSSQPYRFTFLRAELLMAHADGSNAAQLTFFNVPGHVEFLPYSTMTVRSSWSEDGTKLLVTLQLGDAYPDRQMWMLTFAGACGI